MLHTAALSGASKKLTQAAIFWWRTPVQLITILRPSSVSKRALFLPLGRWSRPK